MSNQKPASFLRIDLHCFENSSGQGVASSGKTDTITPMSPTDTILKFGLRVGRISGAPVRVSFLFVVVAAALIWRLNDIVLGAAISGILLLSVLAHEIAHLVVARSTAGDLDELDLWPLGGLSEPFGRGYWRDHVQTMMAGPFVNALLAATCLMKVSPSEVLPLLNPWTAFPAFTFSDPLPAICSIVFVVNVYLCCINLIPITPFDAGVLVRTWLMTRFSELESRDVMVRLGMTVGSLGLITGFVVDFGALTALSAFVLVFHFRESLRWLETMPQSDFFEYDATDEDRSYRHEEWEDDPDEGGLFAASDGNQPTHEEILERWQRQREQERVDLEREQRVREDRQVDEILQKLHLHGREALDSNEVHLLQRVGDRYRNREHHH